MQGASKGVPCKINLNRSFSAYLWGSDNICIERNKKFGSKKCDKAPVYGALLFLGGNSYANNKNGGNW